MSSPMGARELHSESLSSPREPNGGDQRIYARAYYEITIKVKGRISVFVRRVGAQLSDIVELQL